MKINDPELNEEESFADIYVSLFKWKNENESDNVVDFARSVGKEDEAYRLKELLKLKLREEAILKDMISPIKIRTK